MNLQNPLFDLDEIPMATPEQKAADNRRWYISVMRRDKEYTVIATHDETADWREVGTFQHQPLLYKSSAGARRQGVRYVKSSVPITVKEWKGWGKP